MNETWYVFFYSIQTCSIDKSYLLHGLKETATKRTVAFLYKNAVNSLINIIYVYIQKKLWHFLPVSLNVKPFNYKTALKNKKCHKRNSNSKKNWRKLYKFWNPLQCKYLKTRFYEILRDLRWYPRDLVKVTCMYLCNLTLLCPSCII